MARAQGFWNGGFDEGECEGFDEGERGGRGNVGCGRVAKEFGLISISKLETDI